MYCIHQDSVPNYIYKYTLHAHVCLFVHIHTRTDDHSKLATSSTFCLFCDHTGGTTISLILLSMSGPGNITMQYLKWPPGHQNDDKYL